MSSGNSGHMSDDARFASLSTRVGGLETMVGSISAKFDAFLSKNEDRSRTPWAIVIGFAGVSITLTSAILGAVTLPISNNIARLEQTMQGFQTRAEAAIKDVQASSVPMTMFLDFKASYNSNREISRAEYLDKFGNAKNDQIKDIANLQRQMDELRDSFGGTYSLKDFVTRQERGSEEMANKIADLESKLAAKTP